MREIFATICFAGALQSLLLSAALIIRKNNRGANRFLAIALFFGAVDLFELYLGSRGLMGPARPYQLSIIPYSLVFGPSFYLYIVILTGRIRRLSLKHMLIYLPFIIALAANILLQAKFDATNLPRGVVYANIVINGGGLVFEEILYVISFVRLQRYTGCLKDYFSAIDSMKLLWFRVVLVVLIASVVFIFVPYTGEGHVRNDYNFADAAAIICGLLFIFGFALVALLQPDLLSRLRRMDAAPAVDDLPRYEKFRLPEHKEKEYVDKLQNYMNDNKPYLDEELTLQDLADTLSMSTHHLSMILNIHFRQNFYNFINFHRVEDAKRKLIDPEYTDHNILEIAFSAGFNSKSTFNSIFKKFTGMTPREYRAGSSA